MKPTSRYKFLVFFVLLASLGFSQETYRDEFGTASYGNNDGTSSFAADWNETNDNNNPGSGRIQITGGDLRFEDITRNSHQISRTAFLTGAISAMLTFEWQTSGLDNGGGQYEQLSVQASSDGVSFTTIGTFNNSVTTGTFSYDITAYISGSTTIRFINDGTWQYGDWEGGEFVYIDDFQIAVTLPTNDPPVLTATGNQAFCPGTSIPIVETIGITDTDDTTTTAVYIQISSGYINGEDLLTLTGTHPNISSSWDAVQGELSLTGSATYTEYETAIAAVEYSSSGTPTGTRQFSITVGEANFLPDTGHYYEYVPDLGITWTDANAAASARTHFGLQGYLATLTSQEEADFSGSQAPGVGWIGGSDAAVEGDWRWVTGPEAGTPFWTGTAGGSVTAPFNYAFWNTNEPNQAGNEDYAHITHPNVNPNGSWNDLSNTGAGSGDYQPQGYVVEYGGMSGDPTLFITATTTISVDNVAPTASDPGAVTVFCTGDVPTSDITVVTDEADNCTVNPVVTFIGDVSDGGTNPEIITRTYRITDDAGNTTDVTQTITISPVTITGQPTDQSIIAGNNGVFSATVANADTYQWQVSTNGGGSFSNLSDGTEYSNTQSASLTVNSADIDKNGYIFRVIASNTGGVSCTPITSSEVTLTISVETVITNRKITYRVNKN
ncbi:hypothetical protein GGR42_001105 [Saonia flava]|uniref:C-type lectin domain-containing protein n=1 Tax=Saonia flava TaxID=523696 RepID=A0A846QWJ0_9FLAO|nr:C-type lectin domain-containing protein [Saonia flava]NJB70643.1 hypothetical protein [Saonia flava]